MGGKTKNAQRTKNNTKPSNSSRTAGLLGTAAPTFVGFSTHRELGIIPIAPGFELADQLSDTFDASISPHLQIILRKLHKKDPLTKKKALLEFIEYIKSTELETIKNILPIWPKYYHNLANDTDHGVRELSQNVLQILVTECKRAVAPFLKQLVPVWLASQFDSFAPAATIASNCFRDTFANRMQEVCLHCQKEILEYTMANLTVRTAASMSVGKNLPPEDVEHKYQCVIVCSLKELSFFVEQVASAKEIEKVQEGLGALLLHQKFFSYAKHVSPNVKAAWFEFIYQMLQCAAFNDVLEPKKAQLITTSFQNIDESDPLVAPHVWGCVLLLQTNYTDWYTHINFKKALLPKLSTILRNGFNRNTQAICPNLLPFFAKMTQIDLEDVDIYEFYNRFFGDIKGNIIIQLETPLPKTDFANIIKTYFECLRFLLQKLRQNETTRTSEIDTFVHNLIEAQLIEPLIALIKSDAQHMKYFFLHAAALIAFWERQCSDTDTIYTQLLDKFWNRLDKLISYELKEQITGDKVLSNVLELIQNLHAANPSLENQKVKFVTTNDKSSIDKKDKTISHHENTNTKATFKQKELRELTIKLVRFCLDNATKENSEENIEHVRALMRMYNDIDFFKSFTSSETLEATLEKFVQLVAELKDEAVSETIIEMIFKVLALQNKNKSYLYIENNLITLKNPYLQLLVLQHLLSYPFFTEPKIRAILAAPTCSIIIMRIAHEFVVDKNKQKLNLLHKCFFQTNAAEILISVDTVDEILLTLSEPLMENTPSDMIDICGSFIAQIMPVACSNANASVIVLDKIFLRLFKFSICNTPNDYLSEDTIWEITTSWQDALSCQDIIVNDHLLIECGKIIELHMLKNALSIENLETIAEITANFIICATEFVKDEKDRLKHIDVFLSNLFASTIKTPTTVSNLKKYLLHLEALKGEITNGISVTAIKHLPNEPILRHTLLNISIIMKLIFKNNETDQPIQIVSHDDTDEINGDDSNPKAFVLKEWSDILLNELQECIDLAAVADGFLYVLSKINTETMDLALALTEKVRLIVSNESDHVEKIKSRLISAAMEYKNVTACRALLFLVHYCDYIVFEDSATLILHEELAENFVTSNNLKPYVNFLQYVVPKLKGGSLSLNAAIMRTNSPQLWINAAVFRCLVLNNFEKDVNLVADKNIIDAVLQFITCTIESQKSNSKNLLQATAIHKLDYDQVLDIVEFINLLNEVTLRFPYQLPNNVWNCIRMGLASCALSISQSVEYIKDPKTTYFVISVYKLFHTFKAFLRDEKTKSSTKFLKDLIEQWDGSYDRDVNNLLYKSYYKLADDTNISAENQPCYDAFMAELLPNLELFDYNYIYAFCRASKAITLENMCDQLLHKLSDKMHAHRLNSLHALRQLTQYFVADDMETYNKNIEKIEKSTLTQNWHFLNKFENYLAGYETRIQKYLNEFSFKLSEIDDFENIEKDEVLGYLLLWDCIIYVCTQAPVTLRSVYTSWLHDNKHEENFLHFLFRAMPCDILKNHSAKVLSSDVFKPLAWSQYKDENLPLERYVCCLYTETLRRLPAVVRKWWNKSSSRQKNFIDNLTTNYVSSLICMEELKAISGAKDKHKNMQVTVHVSTREVLAVYSIDEACMELVITLAPNYPLGSVKVECGKQIGGRAHSRNVGMQLTILLTHQNGTIFDGLTMWKNNLDKKFEGVEECYVCYTVIHHDTCQLPKLSCKTCKKKFHGPCLYKWFTTSSKSTCPICRNVF